MTAKPPPQFSEPSIFHKLDVVYLAVHARVLKFPKASRHSLGVRTEQAVLEIMELAYLAMSKRGASRLLILNKADIMLKILTCHLRLAHQTRCLSDTGFAGLIEKTVELGNMLGGWILVPH